MCRQGEVVVHHFHYSHRIKVCRFMTVIIIIIIIIIVIIIVIIIIIVTILYFLLYNFS